MRRAGGPRSGETSELPRLQRIDDLLALGILDHRPAGDLVDGALAADAEARLAVDDADALAGRHHPPREWRWRRLGHDPQDFLLSSASWLCSSSSLRLRSSIAPSLSPAAGASCGLADSAAPLAFAGGIPAKPVPNGLNIRIACSNIAMFCLPIDSNCWNGLKPKAFCRYL